MRFYRVPFVEPVFKVAVTLLRGVPLALFFLVIYRLMSVNPLFSRPFIAAFVLSIPATVNVSELVRGSLESIDKSQFDAAYSVGHSGPATFFRIIVPQLVPVCIPMLGNVVIWSLKSVPIATFIGVMDILNTALMEATINYRYLEAYVAAGIIFWALFIVVEKVFALIENNFKKQSRKPAAA
jgi:L-cystine transport system permease protein